jgi:hypothetical protein
MSNHKFRIRVPANSGSRAGARAAKAAIIVCIDISATQTANDGVYFQRKVPAAGVEVVAYDALL